MWHCIKPSQSTVALLGLWLFLQACKMVCILTVLEQYNCAAYYSSYVKYFAVKQLDQGCGPDLKNQFYLSILRVTEEKLVKEENSVKLTLTQFLGSFSDCQVLVCKILRKAETKFSVCSSFTPCLVLFSQHYGVTLPV